MSTNWSAFEVLLTDIATPATCDAGSAGFAAAEVGSGASKAVVRRNTSACVGAHGCYGSFDRRETAVHSNALTGTLTFLI